MPLHIRYYELTKDSIINLLTVFVFSNMPLAYISKSTASMDKMAKLIRGNLEPSHGGDIEVDHGSDYVDFEA